MNPWHALLLVLAGAALATGALGGLAYLSHRRRRKWDQWFRPSDGPRRGTPAARVEHPGTRPIVGQRPAEGRHRPQQQQARFGGRTFRSRR